MAKRKKPKYEGALNKRLPPGQLQMPVSWMFQSDLFGNAPPGVGIIGAEQERLELLLDHYSIPRDEERRWEVLSLAMARDHGIPGFQVEARGGGKSKGAQVTAERMFTAYLEVDALLERTKKGPEAARMMVDRACKLIQKKHFPDVMPKTVSSWYYKVEGKGGRKYIDAYFLEPSELFEENPD